MAAASSASAFSLHPDTRLLDEHDRMLFQYSHPAGADAERTPFEKGSEGFSAPIPEAVQRESHALHLDQRARAPTAHHRSDPGISSSTPQGRKAKEEQS